MLPTGSLCRNLGHHPRPGTMAQVSGNNPQMRPPDPVLSCPVLRPGWLQALVWLLPTFPSLSRFCPHRSFDWPVPLGCRGLKVWESWGPSSRMEESEKTERARLRPRAVEGLPSPLGWCPALSNHARRVPGQHLGGVGVPPARATATEL